MSILATDTPRSDRPQRAGSPGDAAARQRRRQERARAAFERAVRNAYFSQMGEAESACLALGVSPDRVVAHLAGAMRIQHMRPAVVGVLHLADIGLAAACIDGDPAAWALLQGRAERALVRAGGAFHTGRHAVLRARRLLAEVQEATRDSAGATLDLRRYAGDAPIRAWLVERLMGGIARDLAAQSGGQRSSQEGAAGRLESTLRLLRAEALRERPPLRRAEGDDAAVLCDDLCDDYDQVEEARC